MANDKRARKKAARDAAVAAQWAAYRRRRNARIGTVVAALLAIVVLAVLVNDDPDKTKPAAKPGNDASADPTGAACGAETPLAADPKTYDSPPPMALEDGVDYRAVIATSCGDIEIDLLEDKAPVTVNNFIFLAREGFYDGLIWHRVEQNSVIQTGDPNGQNGTEPDGAGYAIEDELPAKDREYVYGVVGMANSGPNSGSSQFFIVTHDYEGALEGNPEPAGFQALYSIFGQVDEASWEILEELQSQPIKGGTDQVEAVKPVNPIYIETITILEN